MVLSAESKMSPAGKVEVKAALQNYLVTLPEPEPEPERKDRANRVLAEPCMPRLWNQSPEGVIAPSPKGVMRADGALVESTSPLRSSPQYHGLRTKSAASPRVHPRWKSARGPSRPDTLVVPIGSRIVCPEPPEMRRPRASTVAQPHGLALVPKGMLAMASNGTTTPEQLSTMQLPYRRVNWTPNVRPAATPPSGASARLWRPLTGSDRQLAAACSHHSARRYFSPRRAMRVKPLSSTPMLPVRTIMEKKPSPPLAPPPSQKPPQQQQPTSLDVCDNATHERRALQRQSGLEDSLVIGQLQLTMGATNGQPPSPKTDSQVHPSPQQDYAQSAGLPQQPVVWVHANQTESQAVLPALTQGPVHHMPQTAVKLWL